MGPLWGKILRHGQIMRGSSLALAIVFFALFSSGHGATNPKHGQSKIRRHPQLAVAGLVSPTEAVAAKSRLASLGYWTGPMTERPDPSDQFAVVAFQKVTGKTPTGRLTAETLEDLKTAAKPVAAETGYLHIEVDLTEQVLFFVAADGSVSKILPISTGSGKVFTSEGRTRRAVTPVGRFSVQRKINGWRKSPLGLLYYPSYITDGIAIHGNPAVPVYPASHGCIRIPMFAAKEFSKMGVIGTPVLVYGSNRRSQ